ncbi:unnamed protein product [Parnassius apollo]|uniref:(apollo) hypothetical protein n=1 Tax=Parnassius apollo TaxID=110799 RepID=A0A8S3XTZ6_PARAO|nr:unnamed protein product [Parnassius apollo]
MGGFSLHPETIDILSMIPQEFETDSNVFDSDSITHSEVQSQKSSVNTITQEYVITPGDNNDNVQENITPLTFKMQTKIDRRTKQKLTFNLMNDNIHITKQILGSNIESETPSKILIEASPIPKIPLTMSKRAKQSADILDSKENKEQKKI